MQGKQQQQQRTRHGPWHLPAARVAQGARGAASKLGSIGDVECLWCGWMRPTSRENRLVDDGCECSPLGQSKKRGRKNRRKGAGSQCEVTESKFDQGLGPNPTLSTKQPPLSQRPHKAALKQQPPHSIPTPYTGSIPRPNEQDAGAVLRGRQVRLLWSHLRLWTGLLLLLLLWRC